MKYSQSQADHLEILASGSCTDVSGLCSDVVYDAFLQPRYKEVGAFIDHAFLDTRQSIKYDGSSAALDVVYGSLCEAKRYADRDCPSGENIQRSRHDRTDGMKVEKSWWR